MMIGAAGAVFILIALGVYAYINKRGPFKGETEQDEGTDSRQRMFQGAPSYQQQPGQQQGQEGHPHAWSQPPQENPFAAAAAAAGYPPPPNYPHQGGGNTI